MSAVDPMVLQFWGKSPRAGELVERFHPALYHMLDVAFAAEALLHNGPPRLWRALHHAWDGCDSDTLQAWLPFLIATHDLGKISAVFQGQAKQAVTRAQRERLVQAGVVFAPGAGPELYHAAVSALWIHDYLAQYEPGVAEHLIWVLRDAMGGHHGRFVQEGMGRLRGQLQRAERCEPRWAAWRANAYTVLRSILAPPRARADLGAPQRLRPASVALTGFIIWADWMGSNEHDFPACPPDELSLEAYCAESRQRAARALAQAGLDHRRPAPVYHGFSSVFAEIPVPRPLQSAIAALADDDLRGPLLAVIEAPTGEGKTEAALLLARRIAALSGEDESFFALPTMATSNQMFKRLEQFYQRLYGDDGAVRLTHSQALAVEEELRATAQQELHRAILSDDSDPSDPAGTSAAAAIEWFVGSKKAMLAPFGVGTVDQVELAGLNVRHYMLRLFGLAGKVVIIDEIHAYDAYMSTILGHTLEWLASLGCTVVLLSATLPTTRHQALAHAFLRGLGVEQPPNPPTTSYPSIALYQAGRAQHHTCAVFRGEQHFTLRLTPQRDYAAEAQHLLDLVREGGAVARLCNRVDDAQQIYQALREHLPASNSVLLHARFPLDERQKREQQIETLFGKETRRTPDQPLIVVGTQVLEQSLDYDVDAMVSDFAPIDLLLQRAGRLHRHNRENRRPLRHCQPLLEVTLPLDSNRQPNWERWQAIYEPYILWRSWEELNANGTERVIVLPRDYRPLIEAVYAVEPRLPQDRPYADTVAAAWQKYQHSTNAQQAQGRRLLTPQARGRDAITDTADFHFIDDESGQDAAGQLAKTRLGDRITVVPLYDIAGQLALDPGGTAKLSPDHPPLLDSSRGVSQKDLLARAVPISDRRIIAAFRDERAPRERCWPWKEVPPLLRSLYPLRLDRTHSANVAGRSVKLDTHLGLIIEKETL